MTYRDEQRLLDIVAAVDTAHAVVQATVDNDLAPLLAAVQRLLELERTQQEE